MHEWYAYRLNVVGVSDADAVRKVEVFYAQQRRPKSRFQHEGVTAILRRGSVEASPIKVATSTYYVQLHEQYVYDLLVVGTSLDEAKRKVAAFYGRQWKLKVKTKYRWE